MAIEEFKILRNSYGPEYGGAGGAQVNIVTKSGNQYHGNVYYFGRNDPLAAKSYFLSPPNGASSCPPGDLSCKKQKLRRNDYGYTIGGPVKKDKAFFFFFSEEWNVERRGAPRKAWVSTAAERAGNFNDVAGCPNRLPAVIDLMAVAWDANDHVAGHMSDTLDAALSLKPLRGYPRREFILIRN